MFHNNKVWETGSVNHTTESRSVVMITSLSFNNLQQTKIVIDLILNHMQCNGSEMFIFTLSRGKLYTFRLSVLDV